MRDRLLGRKPKDYDVATQALPNEVTDIMRSRGWNVIPTGIDHGTVTVCRFGHSIEVTTLRSDVATDGRHAQVAFTDRTFEDDAARRDFTINGLFETAEGRVLDFVGGRNDLKAGVLRFIGSPEQRIREDYLRILRFFRFWARFNLKPDPASLAACASEKSGIARLSRERIGKEMQGLFMAESCSAVLQEMAKAGILEMVVPKGFTPWSDAWSRLDSIDSSFGEHQLVGRLLLFMGKRNDFSQQAEALGHLWQINQQHVKALLFLHSGFQQLAKTAAGKHSDMFRLIDEAEASFGGDGFAKVCAPIWKAYGRDDGQAVGEAIATIAQVEMSHGVRRRTKLPLDGHDVRTHVGVEGEAIGLTLAALKDSYRNSEWTERSEGIAWAKRKKI